MDNLVRRLFQAVPLFLALFFFALPNEGFATPDKGPVTVTLKVVGSQPAVGNQFQVELTALSTLDVKDANAEFKVEGALTLINSSGLNLGDLKAQVPKTATAVIRVDKSGELQVYGSVFYKEPADPSYLAKRMTVLYLLATEEKVWTGDAGFTTLKVDRLNDRRSRGAVSETDYQKELEAIHTGEVSSSPSSPTPRDQTLTDKEKRDQQLYDQIKSKMKGGSDKESLAVERDPRSISVTATLKWKDGAGGTHAVRFAKVELINSDTSAVITSGQTTASGTVSLSFTPSASIQNVKLKFYAQAALFAKVQSTAGVTYTLITTNPKATAGVADGSILAYGDLVMGNNTDDFNAFSVLDGVLEIALYAGSSLSGVTIAELPVNFPVGGSASFFSSTTTTLNILKLDRYDWDVLAHEYGHYIGHLTGIKGNIGGGHSSAVNLIGYTADGHTYTRDEGLRLAFGEGFPTFFGLSVQKQQLTSILNVPKAGDTFYDDTEDATLHYSIENTDARTLGEDNEASVMRSLWDIYDSNSDAGDNGVSVAFTTIFSTLDAVDPRTVSAAWNALTSGLTTAQLVDYGAIFAQQKIASNPTSPGDNTPPTRGTTAPTFEWDTQGAGAGQHLNVFNVEFYDKTFGTLIHESADITKSVNDTTASYTPSTTDWNTILSNATNGNVIAWFVKGKNNDGTAPTGTYASPAKYLNGLDIGFVIDDTGSMSQEIGGVRDALTAFITALSGSGSTPIIELVTFEDVVHSVITSNVLADVQTQVNALYASGGGDCPESSVEALSFIAPHIKNGGKVLFVTDADPHPGTDIGAVISAMRAKGIRVDVLLSGDCETSFKSSDGKTRLASCNNDGVNDVSLRAQNAINTFSKLAIETGGAFITAEEVNSGGSGTTMYEKAAENVMLGIIEPRITTVFPQQVPLGATLDLLLTGSNTNFSTGSVPSFSTGTRVDPITINSKTYLSATKMRLNITVPLTTTLGFYDVSVESITSRAVETATGTSLLEVVAAPTSPQIIGITPASIEQGATKTLTFYGIGTHFSSGSTLSFTAADGFSADTKLTVQSGTVTATSATQLTAQVTAESDTDLGFRKVSISAAPSTRSAIPPRITPASSSPARASIASVTPSSAKQGVSGYISITGTDTTFGGTSTVSFSGSGITTYTPSVTDSTHLSVYITIDASAASGFRDVTVTTGSEVATITNGFEVIEVANSTGPELLLVTAASSSSTTASVSSVTPSSGQQGKSGTITIVGSNTNFIDGTSTVSFSGSGITVSSTTVTDSTHLTADIQIDSTATAGFRDVFVTTGAEVATKLDGFEVIATIPALTPLGILIALVLVSLALVLQVRRRKVRGTP